MISQSSGGGGRGRGGPWGGNKTNNAVPHYEEDPGWRPRNADADHGGHGNSYRGRGRGRGRRGGRGGPLPIISSSFVKDPTHSQLVNDPNIPQSLLNNLQQTYFTQQRNNEGGGAPHNARQQMMAPQRPMISSHNGTLNFFQPPPVHANTAVISQPPPHQSNAEHFLQSHQNVLAVAASSDQQQQQYSTVSSSSSSSAVAAQPMVSQISTVVAPATMAATATPVAAEQVVTQAAPQDAVVPAAVHDNLTPKQRKEAEMKAAWDTLHQYWQFVQDNPYDFDGWTYLLSHVETMDNIDAARAAFDGFLPLYPYCFAYWKKFADMEGAHGSIERHLGILLEGARCIPACTELWLAALGALTDYTKEHKLSKAVMENAVKQCVNSVGLSWKSVEVWDYYINFYSGSDDLVTVVKIYRELLSTPTKQYNRHWDRFLELVRDHHPRSLLPPEEYEELRKQCCKQLNVKYTPGPLLPPTSVKKSSQPEDKVSAAMKEKLVASLVTVHEANEKAVNKRWKYEERIKRPYFHIKALDRRQLKNWNEYLELEMKEGDPYRIIMLFERCLVACAQYEDVWCKYTRYMEEHIENVKNGLYREKLGSDNSDKEHNSVSNEPGSKPTDETGTKTTSEEGTTGTSSNKSCTGLASEGSTQSTAADTCNNVGEVGDKNCDNVNVVDSSVSDANGDLKQNADSVTKDSEQSDSVKVNNSASSNVAQASPVLLTKEQIKPEPEDDVVCVTDVFDTNSNQLADHVFSKYSSEDRSLWTYEDVCGYVSHGVTLIGRVLACPPLTKKWVYEDIDWEDVRQIYRRATWIHCAGKPLISMQWAQFEEMQGDVDTARQLLGSVVAKHPTLLTARIAQVELERRAGELDRVEDLYKNALSTVIAPKDKSYLSMRYARFLVKVRDNFDSALALLRRALKKDKSNIYLYQHVFDFCCEKRPMDAGGVLAAVMLALQAKDLPLLDKVWFARKKIAFLREHGSLAQIREARKELNKIEKQYEQHLKEVKEKEEAEKKKKEQEEKVKAEQEKMKKEEEEKAKPIVPETNLQQPPPDVNNLQQQFPTPFFGQDGAISYTSMDPSLKPPYMPPMHGQYNDPVHKTPEELELERHIQNQKNIQYEELRTRQLVPPPQNNTSGAGGLLLPPSTLHTDVSQPPPGVLSTSSGLVPPPPFPQLKPYKKQNNQIINQGGAPQQNPLKRPYPSDLNMNESDPKQARLGPRGGQGNLAQFDTNYTEQPGPSAPPSHRATFGSYSDSHMPFSRIGGLSSLLRRRPHGPITEESSGPNTPPNNRQNSNSEVMHHNNGDFNNRHPHGQGGAPPPADGSSVMNGPPHQRPGAYNADGPGGQMVPSNQAMSIPRQIDDSMKQTVNVPEWLVKEGGELRLSSTQAGNSVIRYWPSYMTSEGSQKMFSVLRKNIKWHQMRTTFEGDTIAVPHLLAWVGPCDYSYRGMVLGKNDTWRPEIVDLLHRLMQYTERQYNSCYICLYRNGRDYNPWSCHDHPALREKPVVAIVSLGESRTFEMQRKDGRGYLRFPLFSGSLLLMEGATQTDWVQQVPKDLLQSNERMELTFRTMFMIKGLTV